MTKSANSGWLIAAVLVLEIIRLAYNLVTAFQRNCLQESWQNLTLPKKVRFKVFLMPGELIRPQNRRVLRLRQSSMVQTLADDILRKIRKLKTYTVLNRNRFFTPDLGT